MRRCLVIAAAEGQPVMFGESERAAASQLVALALAEDLGERGDITTQLTIPPTSEGTVRLIAREAGVLAGLPIVRMTFTSLGRGVEIVDQRRDGDMLSAGTVVAILKGPTAQLLTGERTALNFVTHLSGIASLTHRFVQAAVGGRAVVLDTRKTLPGWRVLQKYAVRCGGGQNHRMGLHDGILIKDNHLAACVQDIGREPEHGALVQAVRHARAHAPPGLPIEIEVDSLEQLDDVLAARPEIILLDNFTTDAMREAVRRRNRTAPETRLEASGGVNLGTIAAIAATGVDRISIGALTHSAPALDLAFGWETGA
jgi:nicotinate-nucleotide pyrophosphorylase (carboxylating)